MDPKERYLYDPSDSHALLGKGSYGAVYKGVDRITNKHVAVKVI